jgi:hypothetical protein
MLRAVGLAGVVCLLGSAYATDAPAPDAAGPRMFERMRGLAGSWEGTFEWSGGRTGAGKLRATYYVTGNGSALVEDLLMGEGDAPSMTTVYHLDGPELRMTHFCAAQNQPRLKATQIDVAAGAVDFAFVDVTNASVSPAYVDGFSIRILDADDLNLKFEFLGKSGKKAVETIVLKRVGSVASHS